MSAALSARTVVPELLDTLPPDDPRAIRSRRDLVRVNALMGNAAGIASALHDARPASIAELGGGSGQLLASVARRLASEQPVEAVLVDLKPCVDSTTRRELSRAGWQLHEVKADVIEFLAAGSGCYDAIVANLFLHHFQDAELRRLLQLAARRTRLFVACEPVRTRVAVGGARLLPLLGCNDVTRHDSVVSVRAGFRDRELSALWPAEGWRLEEGRRGFFTHRFVARRA